MTGRLFRFTPHGGKPNHYTDSFRSATGGDEDLARELKRLEIGRTHTVVKQVGRPGLGIEESVGRWERIA